MSNIDQQFIDSHNIKNNWNMQFALLCIYIDWFCRSTGGYCTGMLNHLGACILMVLKHHKDLIDGACLAAFRRQLPEPFVWHTHKEDFKSYQRDSGVLKHIVYGMFGCWQPAFEHGLVCVLHIKVPQFDAPITHEEAMRDVYQACAMQHEKYVWHASIDLHCSDRDGQRWQDWHQNTHGNNVMCKFMVNDRT